MPALYAAPKLADGGSITFVSGALAKRPGKGSTALAVSNAALDAIVKGLANDLGPRLRVNTVSPGLVDTEIWDGMPKEAKEKMLAGFGMVCSSSLFLPLLYGAQSFARRSTPAHACMASAHVFLSARLPNYCLILRLLAWAT